VTLLGDVQDVEAFERAKAELLGSGEEEEYDEDQARRRAAKLAAWLKEDHCLSVEEDSGEGLPVLLVLGGVSVKPPYRPQDCRSANPTALTRLRQLLESFPAEK